MATIGTWEMQARMDRAGLRTSVGPALHGGGYECVFAVLDQAHEDAVRASGAYVPQGCAMRDRVFVGATAGAAIEAAYAAAVELGRVDPLNGEG